MFIAPDDLPLPFEYRFFALDGLIQAPPADIAERTVVFLDCGNIDRNPAERAARRQAPAEHRPPPRQHPLRHARPRRARGLLHGGDRVGSDARPGRAPAPAVAQALYVGLITDTGRFMYENTGPRAHQMAAELIEAGVDVQAVYRRLYEEMPPGKLALLALALAQMQRFDSGELTLAALSAADFDRAEAEESYSEGIIDHLRALQGTKVAALVRELRSGERKGQRKVSLRATDDDVDVSVDRPRPGRRRPPPRRGLLHRRSSRRS